jgi:2-hydroxy-4-carboxymuconate semialdehyde hemiacetal dehydrogenase
LNISFIGHGAVGSLHARGLATVPHVRFTGVIGPDREHAKVFAEAHGVLRVCDSMEEALAGADLAIVSSPSPLHAKQSRECLTAGVNVLVELPPCGTSAQATELEAIAKKNRVGIWCAHTSRYLTPYRMITECLRRGALGSIEQIVYMRHLVPRVRKWTDDALLHHAAHPLDLLMHWFGEIAPVGCVTLPGDGSPESASLLATLPNGSAASVAVSYCSRRPVSLLRIVGSRHTIDTDGFSFVDSDLSDLQIRVDETETYEEAVRKQDGDVVRACCEGSGAVEWKETIRLLRSVNSFQELAKGSKPLGAGA